MYLALKYPYIEKYSITFNRFERYFYLYAGSHHHFDISCTTWIIIRKNLVRLTIKRRTSYRKDKSLCTSYINTRRNLHSIPINHELSRFSAFIYVTSSPIEWWNSVQIHAILKKKKRLTKKLLRAKVQYGNRLYRVGR